MVDNWLSGEIYLAESVELYSIFLTFFFLCILWAPRWLAWNGIVFLACAKTWKEKKNTEKVIRNNSFLLDGKWYFKNLEKISSS